MTSPAAGWAIILLVAGLLLPLGTAGWWFAHPLPLVVALVGLLLTLLAGDRGVVLAGCRGRRLGGACCCCSGKPRHRASPHRAYGSSCWGWRCWRGGRWKRSAAAGQICGAGGAGAVRPRHPVRLGDGRRRLRHPARAAAGAHRGRREMAAHSLPMMTADFVQTFVRAVIPGWADGQRRRISHGRPHRPHRLPAPRPAAAGQPGVGPAGGRHRPHHGDVVRLRLAEQGRRRRGDDLLPDAGEHRGRPCRRRPDRARPDALLCRRRERRPC